MTYTTNIFTECARILAGSLILWLMQYVFQNIQQHKNIDTPLNHRTDSLIAICVLKHFNKAFRGYAIS